MSANYARQQAADEARNAARKSRELADILTEYADALSASGEGAGELLARARTKLERLQENFRKSAELTPGES